MAVRWDMEEVTTAATVTMVVIMGTEEKNTVSVVEDTEEMRVHMEVKGSNLTLTTPNIDIGSSEFLRPTKM